MKEDKDDLIMRYGQCPKCGATGEDFDRKYRKLTETNYWIRYRVCKKCDTIFDFKIESMVGTDSWNDEQEQIFYKWLGTGGLLKPISDMKDNLKLIKSIVNKINRGEYVPAELIEVVREYLDSLPV